MMKRRRPVRVVLESILMVLFLTGCIILEVVSTPTGVVTPAPTATPTSTPDPCTGWWCTVTGFVYADGIRPGNGLEGVTVTLRQTSYCSPTRGQHQTSTDADGRFEFSDVYIHDTDGIRIEVASEGYELAQWNVGGFDCVNCSCFSSPVEILLNAVPTFVERVYPIVLEGHFDSVTSAEFSADGTRIVTASEDGTAIVWDRLTGAPVAVLRGHSYPLTSARFDATGARLVTASLDGTARVWDAASGEQLVSLAGHEGFVNDARFDPSGGRVVTAGEDGSARMWDAVTGNSLAVLRGPGGAVASAVFHPDGSQVATAHGHSTVVIWDAATGDWLFVMPESILEGQYTNLAVRELLFSPDGSRLVAAGEDGFVNVWDTGTGVNLLSINTARREITWVDLSPDGRRLVSAAYLAGVFSIWDAFDGAALATISLGSIINDVGFSPDGTIVATAGADPAVHLWDAATGEALAVLEGHTGPVYTVAFSPNVEELVTAGADGTARIWNASIAVQEAGQGAAPAPVGLDATGPWWALAGAGGLWAVNAGGTGAVRISDHDFGGYDLDITGWAAPHGGRLAYITAEDTYYNAALHITALHNLQDETVIPLTVAETEPARDAGPGDPAMDAASVVIQDDSFAWSPDGRWLAFSAMRHGPTSDLYVFDTFTGDVARLTDDPTQTTRPIWSDDGRFILHTALEGANIDTGMHVQGIWAAAVDGSEVILAYEGEAQLAGWTSGDSFILYEIDTVCGTHGLRAVDLSLPQRSIWEGAFDRVAHDPQSGTVLVAVWADTAASEGCNAGQGPGVFLTGIDGAAPFRIVEDQAQEMIWSPEAQLFFARTEAGVLAISRAGEFIDLVVPPGAFGWPQVAVDTRELAWRGDGLWLGSLTSSLDRPPRQIFSDRTIQAQWTPSGSHLLFTTADGALYVVERPEFTPRLAGEIGVAASAVWVMP